VMLPVRFEDAVTLSLEALIELTRERVDWDALLAPGTVSAGVASVLSRVRAVLPRLRDEDDGAFDAEGRPVLIASGKPSHGGLNCSGFAKWVMDGLYRPLAGRYMEIDELKHKDLDVRGTSLTERYEAERDPFFGLDWTRNMAVALERARTGRVAGIESFDVRTLPYLSYVEDLGFPLDRLQTALYLLALENPDRIFLGSINKDFGRAPVLRQHTHVVVLFPQFDRDGQFRVAVLERNLETGLDALRGRHPDSNIHLVAVDLPPRFVFAPQDPGGTPRL
jgi:hypothetical protein